MHLKFSENQADIMTVNSGIDASQWPRNLCFRFITQQGIVFHKNTVWYNIAMLEIPTK